MAYITIGGLVLILILLVIIIVMIAKKETSSDGGEKRKINDNLNSISGEIKGLYKNYQNLNDNIGNIQQNMIKESHRGFIDLKHELDEGLQQIQQTTEKKLTHIQGDVNKKLDVSLNQRLNDSFATVTKQLSELYKSLGDLGNMAKGIDSLNKTLSNVKTRGTWGETQLNVLLSDILTDDQYIKNVKLNDESDDYVEFAIKIPSKENNKEYIYLPIDSKFPMDKYDDIIVASETGDPIAVKSAIKGLERRIKEESKKIHDKYVSPPTTTDFAILFLPTESLFAEVIRIDGLAEYCQNEYRIVIAGPTTIAALLNSLRIGFANLALNEKTSEIRKLLQAVKTQYAKFDELIDIAQKRLDMAVKSTSELKNRTRIIRKRMSKIDELNSLQESDDILFINDSLMDIDEDNEVDEFTSAKTI